MEKTLHTVSNTLSYFTTVLFSFMLGFYLSYKYSGVSWSLEFLLRCYKYFAHLVMHQWQWAKHLVGHWLHEAAPTYHHFESISAPRIQMGFFYFLCLFSIGLLLIVLVKSIANTMK